MKKVLAPILAIVLMFSMVACGSSGGGSGVSSSGASTASSSPNSAATQAGNSEIVMITDLGSIDDKGFNQGAWEGVTTFAEEKNITHKYYKPTEKTTDAYLSSIDLAITGGAKVIVTPGYVFKEAIYIAQEAYPDVNFILLDGTPAKDDNVLTAPNTVGIQYAEQQSGFLAGYAIVKDGNTSLGFMGGMAVPAVIRYGYGFIQGAEAAAGEMGLESVEISYHYTGTFNATPETQTLAATWFQNGTQVIFACGSGVCNSVLAASEAATPNGKAIGVDIDWSDESPAVVTSAMKALSPTVYQMLDLLYSGNFPGGQDLIMDAASNGVALPMANSRFETFSQADYDAVYAKLADKTYQPTGDTDSSGQSIAIANLPVEIVRVTEIK